MYIKSFKTSLWINCMCLKNHKKNQNQKLKNCGIKYKITTIVMVTII